MKRLSFVLFILLTSVLSFAQNDIYLSDGFSTEDRTLIAKAKRDIQRADRFMQYAKRNYNQYRDLLENKRKGKRRKGEKKTVSGKKNLQNAAVYYDKGYQQLFEVYYNYIGNLKFQFPENQTKALELRDQAEAEFNQGQKLLKSVRNYQEKELKKKVHFKSFMKTVETGKEKELDAVKKLIQAINIYNGEIKQLETLKKEDDKAWQEALAQNTIDAYQSYLDKFPEGRHVSEARSKIEQLQSQPATTDSTYLYQNSGIDLIYRIQVAASRKPLTPAQIRRKTYTRYGLDGLPTYHVRKDGYYKYYVGEYHSYNEASQAKAQIKVYMKKTNPFVVGFYNGEPLSDINEAIKLEQQLKTQY